MTSRERVLASINHKQPDKLPLDIGSTPSSGISAIAYNNLMKHLGKDDKKAYIYDVVQQVAQPDDDFISDFSVDVIDLGRAFNNSPDMWYKTQLSDKSEAYLPTWFKPRENEDGSFSALNEAGEVVARMPKGATFFDQTIFPYLDGYPDDYSNIKSDMDKVVWSKFTHSPWDRIKEPLFWENLRKTAIDLRNTSDKAIMISCGCNLFEWGTFLRRIDNFLMDLLIEPEEVEKLLDVLLAEHLETLKNVCHHLGDVVDIIRLGDDLGTNSNLFMNPEIYRELFKPKHKQLVDYIKKHSSMHTLLHSCGAISTVIPDLIDVGFDILNPVQTTATGMSAERLKKEFGKDICFWGGGCDTKSILNNATPEQVKDHVRKNIEILLPDGGFVFNTVHNIMPDVPPENFLAMIEAVNEYK